MRRRLFRILPSEARFTHYSLARSLPLTFTRYRPKGIVVFSAHWETSGQTLGKWKAVCWYVADSRQESILTLADYSLCPQTVSDYGDENPLLYDVSLANRLTVQLDGAELSSLSCT